jgi:4'-phosphopantetheinyl transferase
MHGRAERTDVGAPEAELVCIDLDAELVHRRRYWRLLSPEERVRSARYRRVRDADRFIVRHGRLRELLQQRLGCAATELPLAADRFGKLSVAGGALAFNLAHSRGVALYAFAWERAVGCDIEWRHDDFPCLPIAERFFHPAEIEALQALPPHRRGHGFFACWTRKEAYLKGIGTGLAVALDSFAVTVDPHAPARFIAGGDGWRLVSWEPLPGYQAALAIAARRESGALPPETSGSERST